MKYGIQMFSVRDTAEHDLHAALQSVAELGYKNVEFAGFFGHPAEEVKGWLSELGLTASGTHTMLDALDADFDGVVAYHKAIGCDTLIVPYSDPKTQAELSELVSRMNHYQQKLAQSGITLGYHNHAHEFAPIEGGRTILEALIADTAVQLEIDTFWVYAAGQNPVEWMQRLHDLHRLPVIHIKDGLASHEGKPLGLGTAPVAAVYAKALELNVPMVVESETLTPSGADEARVCMAYLKTLESK